MKCADALLKLLNVVSTNIILTIERGQHTSTNGGAAGMRVAEEQETDARRSSGHKRADTSEVDELLSIFSVMCSQFKNKLNRTLFPNVSSSSSFDYVLSTYFFLPQVIAIIKMVTVSSTCWDEQSRDRYSRCQWVYQGLGSTGLTMYTQVSH